MRSAAPPLLLALALAACAAPPFGQTLDDLAAELERERASLHLPGFALAVVQDDRVVLARGFGLADVEHGRAVTPETIFALGSTTKAFTATLAGMLADDGALSLDAPVTEYLPWFELPVDGPGPVCLRDLFSHRTGFARMDILWVGGRASPDEVLRTALRAEPIAPFRSRFIYNNVMVMAAGEVCAAAAGEPWDELIRARILEPLDMRATTTSVGAAQRDPRLALGYDWEGERFVRRPMRDLRSIAPACALNSNVLDLARWLRFLLGGGELEGRRLISAQRLAETWEPAIQIRPDLDYCLGWMRGELWGEETLYHDGRIDGFAAALWLLPERRTGVALLANVTSTPLQERIGPRVFAALRGVHVDGEYRSEPSATPERGTDGERPEDGPLPELGALLALHRGAEFEARLAELGPCRVRRTLRFVHCGIRGTDTTLFDARGRFLQETDLAPFVTTSSTSDGERVVAESSLEGTVELAGANRDAALAGSLLALSGDWQRRFDEVRVVRALAEAGRELAVVELRKGAAPPQRLFVDLASGDPVRLEVEELVAGQGALRTAVAFEDWRELEGLRLPGRVVSEDPDEGRIVSELEILEVGVDDAALALLPSAGADR